MEKRITLEPSKTEAIIVDDRVRINQWCRFEEKVNAVFLSKQQILEIAKQIEEEK